MVDSFFADTSDPRLFSELLAQFTAFCRTVERVSRKNSSTSSAFGQGRILDELSHGDGIIQAAIARATGLSAPTVAEMLDKLETVGLVSRDRDGRKTLVYITDSGRAEALRMTAEHDSCALELFSRLSEDEARLLLSLFSRLNGIEMDDPLPENSTAPMVRRGIRLG